LGRVKEWWSIENKLQRVGLNLQGLKDLQDLVGIRIIVLFKRDITRVTELIERNFNVVRMKNSRDRHQHDQFGYSSVHFVAKAKPEWLTIPTFRGLGDMLAEIQLRTLAQHTWATASERLQYKNEADTPEDILRSVHRVSALLETVDLEFERVLEERDAYRSRVNASGAAELNVDTLSIILDDLLPAESKTDPEEYADILSELFAVGIRTRSALHSLWSKNAKAVFREQAEAVAKLTELQEQWTSEESEAAGYFVDRFKRGILWNFVGLIRKALELQRGNTS
jgi:putative GTP pyrophosphokinase